MSTVSIRRGNTLSQLVRDYNRQHGTNFTVNQIARANGISDPNKIKAGGNLIFPDRFETNAPQQVMRNANNQNMVRNGVNESVTINAEPEPLTTTDAQISTTLTPRQLLPMPNRNADTFESTPNNQRAMILQ